MKELGKLVLVLTVICLLCSALLAAVYEKTRGPIAATAEAKRLAYARKVLPADAPAPQPYGVGGVTNFASLRDDGTLVATAVIGRSRKGYAGDIVLMVGISADGRVLDYQVLEHKETPGLGNKIGQPAFKSGIRGRRIDGNWQVRKDGGEIDAVTAATISSRAALDAIRDAIAQHTALSAAIASTPRAP